MRVTKGPTPSEAVGEPTLSPAVLPPGRCDHPCKILPQRGSSVETLRGAFCPSEDDRVTLARAVLVVLPFFAGCGGVPSSAQDASVIDAALTDAPTSDALPLAPTGAPCTRNSDCAGPNPYCVTVDATGIVWPGGYCSSHCDSAQNDPTTGANAACPGGPATCLGVGNAAVCWLLCTAGSCRQGYSCWYIEGLAFMRCIPTAHSECNPTQSGSCPADADAGTAAGVCLAAGPDPVGECVPACSVFRQDCILDPQGNPQGCYVVNGFGEQGCMTTAMLGGDGAACQTSSDCNAGFACHNETGQSHCRAWCGGPGNVTCTAARSCQIEYSGVPTSIAGVCAP